MGRQMTKIQGLIFDIKKYAIHDGPGIRVTIFFKGCPMRCWWCHNPEGQKSTVEPILKKRIVDSESNNYLEKEEIVGRVVTVREVINEIKKDIIFMEQSHGGVTFSGGEPLLQIEFVNELLKECKKLNLHTTIDTSGCVPFDTFLKIIDKVDLFLYDIKTLDDSKHRKYTGVSNHQILSNLSALVKLKKSIIIRIPIIPTINDNEKDIIQFGEFFTELQIRNVELVPYHKLGIEKYNQLQIINQLKDIPNPTIEDLEKMKVTLESFGLTVKIES